MSLLRYGGAEKLSFTARVSGGFARSFGNMENQAHLQAPSK